MNAARLLRVLSEQHLFLRRLAQEARARRLLARWHSLPLIQHQLNFKRFVSFRDIRRHSHPCGEVHLILRVQTGADAPDSETKRVRGI